MTDPITIVNNALSDLGATPIVSFSEGTTKAATCQNKFASARKAVLELHPWNFATFYATLSQMLALENTSYEWAYMHSLAIPNGPYCLKVLGTEHNVPYQVGGRVLWSDVSPQRIKYIGDVLNTGDWQELAVKVLEKWIAAELAYLIPGQSGKKKALMSEAAGMIPTAQDGDSREGTPIVLTAPSVLTGARLRGRALR